MLIIIIYFLLRHVGVGFAINIYYIKNLSTFKSIIQNADKEVLMVGALSPTGLY